MSMEKIVTYGDVRNVEYGNMMTVDSQTSIMVKRPYEAANMEWSWRKEKIGHMESQTLRQRSFYSAKQLLDQKVVTNDTRSQWAKNTEFKFVFERNVKMHNGTNIVSLLSVTVGLPNSDANYETIEHGVIGPVKLIGMSNQERDLSTNTWLYKVGLDGEESSFYEDNADENWQLENLPSYEMFVWYKTNFESPKGEDPVVLDLLSLGKGTAWVNGKNIGRYWPSYLSDEDGCPSSCDYRGAYNPNKCSTNCGKSSQRWPALEKIAAHLLL
ncbi:hypothetical protein RJ639_046728 [Escallonia herrerae]|uniref:Beta-galactosidase galactose-binding domain-containing protein n=1 Tax=Escallonia herrerae TaxID=1293975 RepID=A0AA88WB16_9ASTE|nr:hypothetical protein RJ639_046728 [Escallonia herrerae]